VVVVCIQANSCVCAKARVGWGVGEGTSSTKWKPWRPDSLHKASMRSTVTVAEEAS
jgi:hypothetical protein